MIALILEGELNLASIENLIGKLQDIELNYKLSSLDLEPITIYVNSDGGEVRASEILSDFLNNSNLSIELVGVEYVMSAAIMLFTKFQGKKRLLPGTWGIIHLETIEVNTRDLRDRSSLDSFRQELSNYKEETFLQELEKLEFSPQQIEAARAGKDIYLTEKELGKLIGST